MTTVPPLCISMVVMEMWFAKNWDTMVELLFLMKDDNVPLQTDINFGTCICIVMEQKILYTIVLVNMIMMSFVMAVPT